MAISKLTTSSEAVKFIKDGNSIVLFGGWDPMSLICELIRTGRSNLRVFAHSYSIGADMLLQSGSVETMFYSSPSKEYRERIQLISIDSQAPKHNSGVYNQTPA